MSRWGQTLLCLVLLSLAASAWADDAGLFNLSLEELSNLKVSVATGTPKPLSTAPAVVTVITDQELQTLGAQDIGDALETVPGLHVSNGGFTYAPRYFMRGIASTTDPQTLLLVNGVPQTSLYQGNRGESLPGIYSMPVALIKRIEIIRGPGSALYGADAFAGVINIITKSPDDVKGGEVDVSTGSFNTQRASVLQQAQKGAVSSLFALSYLHSAGATPIIDADYQTLRDASQGTHASLAPGPISIGLNMSNFYSEIAAHGVRLRLNWMDAWNVGTSQGANGALDPNGRYVNEHGSAQLLWELPNLPPEWSAETGLSYLYDKSNTGDLHLLPAGAQLLPSGPVFPDGVIYQASVAQEQARYHVISHYTGWSNHLVSLGAGYYWGDLFRTTQSQNYNPITFQPLPYMISDTDQPNIFQPEAMRTNAYALMQDEWAINNRWELTSGLRYDHFSDVGDTTNPRLALVWQTTPTLTSKLLYGEAFRAPTMFELYSKASQVALGNPNLKPEKLRNLELALVWHPQDRLTWTNNIYAFRIYDLIDFVPDAGQPTFTAQNADRVDGHGFETELSYQWTHDLLLTTNYSYQNTRNLDDGYSLGLAPTQQAYGRVTWNIDQLGQLSTQINWIGNRQRTAGDPRSDLNGYTTVDVILRRHWGKQFEAALIARNLANVVVLEPSSGPLPYQTQPAIPDDLPQPGRNFTLALTLDW